MPRFSPSEMNLVFDCPRKWAFTKQRLAGIPIQDDRGMLFGKGVHDSIKSYYVWNSKHPISRDVEIETRAKEEFYSNSILNEYYTNERKVFDNVLGNFVSFEKKRLATWRQYAPTFVEQRFEAGELHGIIDAYFYEERTIIDWKSGDAITLYDSYILQSAIYKLLLEESGYPVDKFLFVFLGTGRVIPAPTTTKGFVLQQMERVREIAKSGIMKPKFGFHCRVCPFILDCNFFNRPLWERDLFV